jgi:hypothetical protein
MTPKEKALQLLDRYDFISTYDGLDIMDDELTMLDRKQCAKIAVDEMLEEILENWYGDYYNIEWEKERIDYWNEVKHEIEKL